MSSSPDSKPKKRREILLLFARVGRVFAIRQKKQPHDDPTTSNVAGSESVAPAHGRATESNATPTQGNSATSERREVSRSRRITQGVAGIADVLAPGVGLVPLAGNYLKSALELVNKLIKLADKHKQNGEDIRGLNDRLTNVRSCLSNPEIPDSLHLRQLNFKLQALLSDLSQLSSDSALRAEATSQAIEQISEELNHSFQQFWFWEDDRRARELKAKLTQVEQSLALVVTPDYIRLVDLFGNQHQISMSMGETLEQLIHHLGGAYRSGDPHQKVINTYISANLFDLCLDKGPHGFKTLPEGFDFFGPGMVVVMRAIELWDEEKATEDFKCPVLSCLARTPVEKRNDGYIMCIRCEGRFEITNRSEALFDNSWVAREAANRFNVVVKHFRIDKHKPVRELLPRVSDLAHSFNFIVGGM
ncbi:hypothetical protein HGRIS_014745 [Hohenbuehelia grisea]|uniref:Uncharacterized protein n=1 Tax=Hohenbuehelia grisea TaxID=104357 RepID=A0ABR3IQI4_9AGAR